MISTFSYNKGITVIQLLVIIISFVKMCENSPTDYDLPYSHEIGDYSSYHFRMFPRYNQSKVNPEQFFKSIYSRTYRVLPSPYIKDYESYKNVYSHSEMTIDVDALHRKVTENDNDEDYEENDGRYLKEDSDIHGSTNEIFNQSQITNQEYENAKQYYDSLPKKENSKEDENQEDVKVIPNPLSSDEFDEIMAYYELLPKYYETGETFIKARVGLGKLIGQSFIDLGIKGANRRSVDLPNKEYNTDLVDLGQKDVHIKDENFNQYSLRLMYLDKVPFHPDICNQLYGTNHSIQPGHTYSNLTIDLTKN